MNRRVALGLAVAATILASCVLPYAFPPSEVVIGPASELGFNNSVAFVAYAALVIVAGLITSTLLPSFRNSTLGTWGPWPRGNSLVLTCVLLAHAAMFVAIYAYSGRFLFADAIYFQTLLYRTSQGELPYIDFGFYYGPSMLYPAHWLGMLLGPNAGYGVAFVTTYLLGLVVLFVILHRLLRSPRVAVSWFVALAVGLFTPLATLNFAFFRFLLPTLAFLVAYDAVPARSRLAVASAGVLLGFAFSYSFEVAVLSLGAAAFAVITALVDRTRSSPRVQLLARGALIMTIGLLVVFGSFLAVDTKGRALLAYPDIALSYVSGAHNIPVYPNLPFLLLLGATVVALGTAFRSLVAARGGNSSLWPLVGLGAVALVTERAAIADFEVAHILAFGLPALILAIAGVEALGGAFARRALLLGAIFGWMLPIQYYHATQLSPAIVIRQTRAGPHADAQPLAADRASIELSIQQLVESIGADKPYLMPGLEYYSLPVYQRYHLRYPSYEGYLITAKTRAGILRLTAEVQSSGAIVIVRSSDLAGDTSASPENGQLLDLLAGTTTPAWPLAPVVVRNQTRLYAPFFEVLRHDYVVLAGRGGLLALGPRTSAVSRSVVHES